MFRLLAIFLTMFAPTSWGLELILPEYRSDNFNRGVLLSWQDQLEPVTQVSSRTTTPLLQVERTLKRKSEEPALIEIPPVFYHQAIELGWTPVGRLRDLGYMIAHALPGTTQLNRIGTPPANTIAARIARRVAQPPFVEFKDHEHCIRAVASGQLDACITSRRFVSAYGKKYQIEFVEVGAGAQAPPSLIMASPAVSEVLVEQMQNLTIDFPHGAAYIPFDPDRDQPLLDTLLEG